MKELSMKQLEHCFNFAKEKKFDYVAVYIQMEGYSELEIIINKRETFDKKLAYYKQAYNNELVLKAYDGIRIVDFDVCNHISLV